MSDYQNVQSRNRPDTLAALVLTVLAVVCAVGQNTNTNAPTLVFRDRVVPGWFANASGGSGTRDWKVP